MDAFRPFRLLAALGAAILCVARPVGAEAQTVTGTIFGRVADSSGGVMPGVTVTLVSGQLIGGAQSRVTSDTGEFRIPALPPGTYEVRFELQGFRRVIRS